MKGEGRRGKKNGQGTPPAPSPFRRQGEGKLRTFSHPLIFPALSGLLLALSFPGFSLGFLAWIALVPLLVALLRQAGSYLQALRFGFLTSLIFFCISLHWLTEVSFGGWVFVVFLETAFFLFFVWAIYEGKNIRPPLLRILWTASAWTTAEWLRSEVPIFGLGWNLLAYSQSAYLWIAQSAGLFGAYGLGFVIAFVNALVAETICFFIRPEKGTDLKSDSRKGDRSGIRPVPFSFIFSWGAAGLVLIFLLSYGAHQLRTVNGSSGRRHLRIALVQGNIPQAIKWETVAREKIIEIYTKLTALAGFDQPHLVIWPEAAYPGYFNRDRDAAVIQNTVKKIGVPLVVGSPHWESEALVYNSAYLLSSDGEVKARYDKQYLVPFGEYVPLKPVFGWLEPLAYSLGVSDFSAGHKPVLFKILNGEVAFSTLICFEDVFSGLARAAVQEGADFLAVITNDAWFGNSAAPYQHLQASIFRAIENSVPVVRAANTGVSAFISSTGKVLGRVHDSKGKDIFVTGKQTLDLPLNGRTTSYQRGGWLFPYAALALFAIILAAKNWKKL